MWMSAVHKVDRLDNSEHGRGNEYRPNCLPLVVWAVAGKITLLKTKPLPNNSNSSGDDCGSLHFILGHHIQQVKTGLAETILPAATFAWKNRFSLSLSLMKDTYKG